MKTHIDTGAQTQNILGEVFVLALADLGVETQKVNFLDDRLRSLFPKELNGYRSASL